MADGFFHKVREPAFKIWVDEEEKIFPELSAFMASCEVKDASESEVTPPDEQTLDFDEDTLRAIAEVNKNEGNIDEYRKKHFSDAVYFYTEGIKVGCKDKELKAKLYSNRAVAEVRLPHKRIM